MSRFQSKQISADELRELINEAYADDDYERIAKLQEYGVCDEEVDWAISITVEIRLSPEATILPSVDALCNHIASADIAGVTIRAVNENDYDREIV